MGADHPRILVVDDEMQIRRFLRISLTSQGYVVSEAETGGLGLIMAMSDKPDLVLLDLGLPDIDGQEVLRTIRDQSDIPVVVVSVRASENEKVACLDAGANDYITKPFGIQELLARVRAVLRQRRNVNEVDISQRLQAGELIIDLETRRVTLSSHPIKLTPKEYAVLTMLAEHPGRVITQTQLLKQIWGPVHVADTHYLRIVISKLRHKLGDSSDNPLMIQTEPGVGYRLSNV
ncbi:response regulator transcription factor [Cobetia sp. 4B]|uniref:response regulator n=1 Tax=Cobetia TaxID=204286 RepID=UPI001C05791C|nr:response regulator transcription factor [Cobetia sp. 4B]QWN38129.1 response regulator transcription factor [Cobetia sp. 4B]